MLADLIGIWSLLVGVVILFLPLFFAGLSRPKDWIWSSNLLLFGLVLVTNSDLFRGPPVLAVLSASFLIGGLVIEVCGSRWQQLSEDEKNLLYSFKRWQQNFQELFLVLSRLGSITFEFFNVLKPKPKKKTIEKKWVRPESKEVLSEKVELNSNELPKEYVDLPPKQVEHELDSFTPSRDS